MRKSSSSTHRSTASKDSYRSKGSGSTHGITTTTTSSVAPTSSTPSRSSSTALPTKTISNDSAQANEIIDAGSENYLTGKTGEEINFNYEIESQTHKRVKINGKWGTLTNIKWKNTLMLTHDVVVDREKLKGARYGLPPESRKLVMASDMNREFKPQPGELYCRYCLFQFLEKDELKQHEREDCQCPGGPKHVCISTCPKSYSSTDPFITTDISENRTDERMPKKKKRV
uniref:Uncharacterized protein n=1 Tax=Tetranychus urticae TaxID=32264 RepID=T1L4E2_TETUR